MVYLPQAMCSRQDESAGRERMFTKSLYRDHIQVKGFAYFWAN